LLVLGSLSLSNVFRSKSNKKTFTIIRLYDAKNIYLVNAFVYIRKEDRPLPNSNRLLILILTIITLIALVYNINRNITGDNLFSSY